MFKLANLIMGGVKFLGEDPALEYGTQFQWVTKVVNAVKLVLAPILGVVGAAGIIWAIVLGVAMARADSQEKREEAKKRLIALIIGIVILVVLIVFFTQLFEPLLIQIIGKENLPTTTPVTPA